MENVCSCSRNSESTTLWLSIKPSLLLPLSCLLCIAPMHLDFKSKSTRRTLSEEVCAFRKTMFVFFHVPTLPDSQKQQQKSAWRAIHVQNEHL
jgi:hypothetical protein